MEGDGNGNSAPVRRRPSRQRSLQSTLDKLLGIKSESEHSPITDQHLDDDHHEPISESVHSPVDSDRSIIHSPKLDLVDQALRQADREEGHKLVRGRLISDDQSPRDHRRGSIRRGSVLSPIGDDQLSRGRLNSLEREGSQYSRDGLHSSMRIIGLSPRAQSISLANDSSRSRRASIVQGHLRPLTRSPREHNDTFGYVEGGQSQSRDRLQSSQSQMEHIHSRNSPRDHLNSSHSLRDHLHSKNASRDHLQSGNSPRDHLHSRHSPRDHLQSRNSPRDRLNSSHSPRDHLQSPNNHSTTGWQERGHVPHSSAPPPYSPVHQQSPDHSNPVSPDNQSPDRQWSPPSDQGASSSHDDPSDSSPPSLKHDQAKPKPKPRHASRSSTHHENESSPEESPNRVSSVHSHKSPNQSMGERESEKSSKILYRREADLSNSPARRRSSSIASPRASVTGPQNQLENTKKRPQITTSANSLYTRPITSVSLISLNNPVLMRRSAYQDWLARKQSASQDRKKLEVRKQAEEKEKLKEKEIKRQVAQATYESWKKNKNAELAKKVKSEKRKATNKEKEEKQKKEEKIKDAEKMFQSWKSTKDETIKAAIRDRRKSESAKLEKKKEEERQKRTDAMKVFQEWKRKKDTEFHDFSGLLKKAHRQQQQETFSEQIERDLQAQKTFELWLERKERDRVDKAMLAISPSPSATLTSSANQLIGPFNSGNVPKRPPWIPSNPTVPKEARLAPRRNGVRRSRSAGMRL